MYRTQAARIVRTTAIPVGAIQSTQVAARRTYAGTAGTAYTPNQAPQPDNTWLYVGLGVAAAGGAYVYMRKNPDDVQDMKDRARREAGELKQKGKETAGEVRERADSAISRAEGKIDRAKDEGRSIGEDLEAKYDRTKGGVSRARESTERYYNEARQALDEKAAEARGEASKKAEEAKGGLWHWFGWGKSSVQSGVQRAESEADRVKRDAAERVAQAAERVHARAEE